MYPKLESRDYSTETNGSNEIDVTVQRQTSRQNDRTSREAAPSLAASHAIT
jgi:hypothetical protein